jgi:hypothetical protein
MNNETRPRRIATPEQLHSIYMNLCDCYNEMHRDDEPNIPEPPASLKSFMTLDDALACMRDLSFDLPAAIYEIDAALHDDIMPPDEDSRIACARLSYYYDVNPNSFENFDT